MQNWKNTADLLTAANTRLKRVKKHIQNTDKESWTPNINHAIAIIDDIKRDLKKEANNND
jgi:flagellin-specific chaperone FliS